MKLYLIRHAVAEERDAELWPDDSARPLTSRGSKRFRRTARGLTTLVPEVDVVLTSPRLRAVQTANLISKAGWPAPVIRDALGRRSPDSLAAELMAYSGRQGVALIGHEPGLSLLAGQLLDLPRAPWRSLKKGGVACLEQTGLGDETRYDLLWVLPPRILRAL